MEAVRRASDVPLPGGNFHLFVTRLSIQAMISMGLLENPLTKRKEATPGNARMLLMDLEMLREKMVGNLDDEEEAHLDKVIADLESALTRLQP
ncbi:MAG: DUF1844 domain-containing protein [Planctomycetota bacterium]